MSKSNPANFADLEHQLRDAERRLLELDFERENLLQYVESLKSKISL